MVAPLMFLFLQLLLAIYVLLPVVVESKLATSTSALAPPFQPKPGCQTMCGDVSIPFPFGIGEDCCLASSFQVSCDPSDPPKLYLGKKKNNIQITNISLNGELHTPGFSAMACYDNNGNKDKNSYGTSMTLERLTLYGSRNKLVVIGCDSYGELQSSSLYNNNTAWTACGVTCDNLDFVTNYSCTGKGCCQVDIPDSFDNFSISATSVNNHAQVWRFNPCTYAFIVQDDTFNFTSDRLKKGDEVTQFPLVLEWALNITDNREGSLLNSMCAANPNSRITKSSDSVIEGYRCECLKGYGGNPYLQSGCQDINECDENLHDCIDNKHCRNKIGSYECFCPKGHHGYGRREPGQGCNRNQVSTILTTIGVTCGVTLVFTILTFIYWSIQRRKINKRKEKHYIDNGGLMLQNLISSNGNTNIKKVRIFKEDELKKATNNFNKSAVVGEGGFGTVFKGTLGNELVAIKKSKVSDPRQIGQFINEMMILSQINHPNVVKLVGCCLETEVPLLVYEFIENKTLEHHICNDEFNHLSSQFVWKTRLRIAAETAEAIAHMHEPPKHIIHRDIKSANILLDHEFTAKVSDFGASRLIPLDQTQLTTAIQGTYGYLDPGCFQTGLLNDKSDVYSFGVVLVELLMGQTVSLFTKRNGKDNNNLVLHFSYALREDRVFDIIDENVRDDEGIRMQVKGVAEVAGQCLNPNGEKRPTMMQVKKWLEEMRKDNRFIVEKVGFADAKTVSLEPLLIADTNTFGCSSSTTSMDILRNQALGNLPDGR